MSKIYDICDVRLDDIVFHKPISINGSSIIRITQQKNDPLYIQFPTCKTRAGIVKTGKKYYCDLLFNNFDDEFIDWIQQFEQHCYRSLFKNKEWFTSLEEMTVDITMDDIENFFSPSLKIVKSGKTYVLRANIPEDLGIFDESEMKRSFEDVADEDIITIMEFQGIKCSAKNFQIEMTIRQILLTKTKHTPLFDTCRIKTQKQVEKKESNQSEEIQSEEKKESRLEENQVPDTNKIDDDNTNKIDDNTNKNKIVDDKLYEVLDEITTSFDDKEESIVLKPRNDIHYKMYRDARTKAKIAKQIALTAYIEAKRIKNEYMLTELDDSDNDSDVE